MFSWDLVVLISFHYNNFSGPRSGCCGEQSIIVLLKQQRGGGESWKFAWKIDSLYGNERKSSRGSPSTETNQPKNILMWRSLQKRESRLCRYWLTDWLDWWKPINRLLRYYHHLACFRPSSSSFFGMESFFHKNKEAACWLFILWAGS